MRREGKRDVKYNTNSSGKDFQNMSQVLWKFTIMMFLKTDIENKKSH